MSRLTKPISTIERWAAALLAREAKAGIVAKKMRVLTGVREEILDVIPSERTRYTAMAAVMMCTATFGGFSMFFALSEVMGGAEFWFVPFAMFWSLFVLCVDCWLISSSTGSRWRSRASILVPRLLVAMFIGAFIAEPIVLRVFQTAIVSQVRDQRQQTIDELRTALVACNPVPGSAATALPPGANCRGMTLGIPSPVAGSLQQLATLQGQDATLQQMIATENNEILKMENRVNTECNGVKENGVTTGLLGDGPACHQDQRYLAQYKASHPVDAQLARLTAMDQRIASLRATISGQQTAYRDALATKISVRLSAETLPSSTIGMGERFEALGRLSLASGFIGVASWFVRIFFVLIDCLPVLVKFISGTTPYDRLAESSTSFATRSFVKKAEAREAAEDEDLSVLTHDAKVTAAANRRDIDLRLQRHHADAGIRKDDAVDELWRRKLAARGFTGTHTGSPPKPARSHNGTGPMHGLGGFRG